MSDGTPNNLFYSEVGLHYDTEEDGDLIERYTKVEVEVPIAYPATCKLTFQALPPDDRAFNLYTHTLPNLIEALQQAQARMVAMERTVQRSMELVAMGEDPGLSRSQPDS